MYKRFKNIDGYYDKEEEKNTNTNHDEYKL
jgi:hypothetical protein